MISGRYSVTVVAREGGVYVMTLIVKEATVADSGTYTCLAANRLGQAKANLKLDLSQGEPRSSPGSFSLSRGKFSEGNGCFCFFFSLFFFSIRLVTNSACVAASFRFVPRLSPHSLIVHGAASENS